MALALLGIRGKRVWYLLQVIPTASEEQLLLVELVRSISVMRTETVIQTVKEVLKQPPAIAKDKVWRQPHGCEFQRKPVFFSDNLFGPKDGWACARKS